MNVHSASYTEPEPKGRCIRATMLLISALTMFVGFAIFVFGVYLYISKSEIIAGVNLLGLLLSIGFFVFLLASLGFCGAYKRSIVWLCFYSCVVLLLIIGEIALIIIVTTKALDVDAFLEDRWAELDNDSKVTVQERFECCGYPTYNEDSGVPCPPLVEAVGCMEGLENNINEFMLECAIAAGVAGFLEITMFVLGCCLVRAVNKE